MKSELQKDRVLVEPDVNNERLTEAGIIIPRTVKPEKLRTGTVIQAGSAIDDLKEGDRVGFISRGVPYTTDKQQVCEIMQYQNILIKWQ